MFLQPRRAPRVGRASGLRRQPFRTSRPGPRRRWGPRAAPPPDGRRHSRTAVGGAGYWYDILSTMPFLDSGSKIPFALASSIHCRRSPFRKAFFSLTSFS